MRRAGDPAGLPRSLRAGLEARGSDARLQRAQRHRLRRQGHPVAELGDDRPRPAPLGLPVDHPPGGGGGGRADRPAALGGAARPHRRGPAGRPRRGRAAAATMDRSRSPATARRPPPTGRHGSAGRCARRSPGLGTTAKGLALEAYEARTLTGVAQFYDPALRVHRKFGPMQLLAAVLDLHPVRHTMAYRTEVFAPTRARAGGRRADRDARPARPRCPARAAAQARRGTHELFILSPGLVDDRVPILERPL